MLLRFLFCSKFYIMKRKLQSFSLLLTSDICLMFKVKCLDSFTSQQTRLVVIVDGLDSCEQDKVLLVLDAVHMLFSDTTSPFIIILAIDPHVISKVSWIHLTFKWLYNFQFKVCNMFSSYGFTWKLLSPNFIIHSWKFLKMELRKYKVIYVGCLNRLSVFMYAVWKKKS